MEVTYFSDRYLQKLHNAAASWIVGNEPQMMLELIGELQRESIKEGYKSAVDVLQDTFSLYCKEE